MTASSHQDDLSEIAKILREEGATLRQDEEVERVMRSFAMNPYEVLGLAWEKDREISESDIHRKYRQLSLFIHPDRVRREDAEEAFQKLEKARADLLDATKRRKLNETLIDARGYALKEANLPTDLQDSDERVRELEPPLGERVRVRVRKLLVDDEVRRRQVRRNLLEAEGEELRKIEDARQAHKRRMEEEIRWENTRVDRVDEWRDFERSNQKKVKKKKKIQVLG